MSALTPRPGIMKIAPYVPGKDSVEGKQTIAKRSKIHDMHRGTRVKPDESGHGLEKHGRLLRCGLLPPVDELVLRPKAARGFRQQP